jgi:hypothetical protein
MAKKIEELGYKAGAVVCGKFFNLGKVMTFEEMAQEYGYENDEADNKALKHAFSGAGYRYVGCVDAIDGLDEECGVMGGYLVKNTKNGRLYVVVDVWDEARGRGMCKAYRFNVLTSGSFEYKELVQAYNKIQAAKLEEEA